MGKRTLNVRKLVHHFGGPTELQQRLSAAGHNISVKGINMWVTRRSLPSDWVPELIALAEEDGGTLRLQDFTEGASDEEMSFLE